MADLEILSVVAAIDALPEKGIRRGQVGTIVDVLAPGLYEVEFSDEDGRAYAFAALSEDKLIRLYHQPEHHAA